MLLVTKLCAALTCAVLLTAEVTDEVAFLKQHCCDVVSKWGSHQSFCTLYVAGINSNPVTL